MIRDGATKLARHNTTKYVIKLFFDCVVLVLIKFFLN